MTQAGTFFELHVVVVYHLLSELEEFAAEILNAKRNSNSEDDFFGNTMEYQEWKLLAMFYDDLHIGIFQYDRIFADLYLSLASSILSPHLPLYHFNLLNVPDVCAICSSKKVGLCRARLECVRDPPSDHVSTIPCTCISCFSAIQAIVSCFA